MNILEGSPNSKQQIDRFITPALKNRIQESLWSDSSQVQSQNKYGQYLRNEIMYSRNMQNLSIPKYKSKIRSTLNMEKKLAYFCKSQQVKQNCSINIKQIKYYNTIHTEKMIQDFYINLLDWSANNLIGACFKKQIHLFKPANQQYRNIVKPLHEKLLSSIKFDKDCLMAVGNVQGQISIWDLEKKRQINNIKEQFSRINSLSWFDNYLAFGSSNGSIQLWDKRISRPFCSYKAHHRQTCGLKWNKQGKLLASGGNDTNLFIFEMRLNKKLVSFQNFKGAIKAIDWCPINSQIIAAGGGSMDKTIRFFNIKSLRLEYKIETSSQVCNLSFSKISDQMVTCHGYSLNQINIWKCPNEWKQLQSIKKRAMNLGLESRVLNIAFNQKGSTMATTGNKVIRLWHPFENLQQFQTFASSRDLR